MMRNFRTVSNETAVEIFSIWTATQPRDDREAAPYGGRRLIEPPANIGQSRIVNAPPEPDAEAPPPPHPTGRRKNALDPSVAEKIIRLRRQYGLSVETLAERFGLGRTTVETVLLGAK